jgi:hypothetical protein
MVVIFGENLFFDFVNPRDGPCGLVKGKDGRAVRRLSDVYDKNGPKNFARGFAPVKEKGKKD